MSAERPSRGAHPVPRGAAQRRKPEHSSTDSLIVPAPAKLNLFLHLTGRRADGYHELESLFVLIDLADTIALALRDDDAIVRSVELPGVTDDDDLALRAARALRDATGTRRGVTIGVTKRIPMGAGLGGGSSDAASVLLGLNRLWAVRLPRDELSDVARALGADVPFFIGANPALARGIGERLTPMSVPACWFVLAMPAVHVPTVEIFAAPQLTRSTPSAKMNVFSEGYGRNDLQEIATARYPLVRDAVMLLRRVSASARMTGSGACAFASFATERDARAALASLPAEMPQRVVRAVARHPLASFA